MLEMELEKHLQVVVLRDQYWSNDFLFLTVNHAPILAIGLQLIQPLFFHSIQREQYEIMTILLDMLNRRNKNMTRSSKKK
jgi:hypothetical protein